VEFVKLYFKEGRKSKPVTFDRYHKAVGEVMPYVEKLHIDALSHEEANKLVKDLQRVNEQRKRLPDQIDITVEAKVVLANLAPLRQPKVPFEAALYTLYSTEDPKRFMLLSKSYEIRRDTALRLDTYALYPFLKPVREGEARPPRVRAIENRLICPSGTPSQREAGRKIADQYEALFSKRKHSKPVFSVLIRNKHSRPMVVINGSLYAKPQPTQHTTSQNKQTAKTGELELKASEIRHMRRDFLDSFEEKVNKSKTQSLETLFRSLSLS